ncbi:MAG: MBL fold metallo-hydrolase [Actinomycetia bacterium]|nr:MBL fold metallo-hydrolase [Actinomycetes bacterium]
MRITITSHAGGLIETSGGSILCDPWFNPAFFGSWFTFPRTDTLDFDLIAEPDYLYISHLHLDHLDVDFLRDNTSKEARVLLPDFQVSDLENELRDVGFKHFIRTRNDEPVELDGDLRIAIRSLRAPHIGPMGDSALVVADPSAVLLNQNDAHPADLDVVSQFGACDVHMLQHSGAIWYPMVYDLDPDEMVKLVGEKRSRQMRRAVEFIRMVNARFVVPTAGPPCFLDPELFQFNDFSSSEPDTAPTIFPDASVFIDHMRSIGHDEGVLMIPGSSLEVGNDADGTVAHPITDDELHAIFADKRNYLLRYQADSSELLAREHGSWPTDKTDLVAELADWLDPVLAIADHTAAGIGANIIFETDDGLRIVFDMQQRCVREAADGEAAPFVFCAHRPLVESSVRRRIGDWCNELFLSCRFSAHRDGPYNEYVYTFFKSLSLERMQVAEAHYGSIVTETDFEWTECDGWIVQKRCPHQSGILDRVGSVKDGVLTCDLHGWKFDLPSGRCINSESVNLEVKGPADEASA